MTLGVVAIHLLAGLLLFPSRQGAGELGLMVLVDTVARAGVPGFVLLSGALLCASVTARPRPPGQFALRRASRLLPPYLFWSAVLTTLMFGGPGSMLAKIGRDWLCGSAAYHTYFVPLIVHLQLAFPLLLRALRRPLTSPRGALAVAAIAYAVAIAWPWLGRPLGGLAGGEGLWAAYLRSGPLLAAAWLPWFVIGLAAGAHLEPLLTWLQRPMIRDRTALLAAAAIVGVAARRWIACASLPDGDHAAHLAVFGYLTWDTPLVALPVLASLPANLPRFRADWLAQLGTASYGIYLVHVVLLELLRRQPAARAALGWPVVALAATPLLAVATAWLLQRAARVKPLAPLCGIAP